MDQKLPGRNNCPALDRLKILCRGFDQRQKEDFERKLVIKYGDIRNTVRACRRDEVISKQVKKLWWNVRERGNFGYHRLDMSRRVVRRQQVNELELPPLGFINRTLLSLEDRPLELNFGESESQPHNPKGPEPMHQLREFENLNVLNGGQSQMLLQSDQQPQAWSNIPDIPPAMMHNSIGYQNPNRAFPNFSQQENHIGLQNSHGISMMSQPPQSGGHSRGHLSSNVRRGRGRRTKSYEKAGGRKNPY